MLDVDDLGAAELVLELHHPALDEALALARGVVLGVLGEIAMLPRLGDRLDHGRTLDLLQALQLPAQPDVAIGRHRNLVRHEISVPILEMSRNKTTPATAVRHRVGPMSAKT